MYKRYFLAAALAASTTVASAADLTRSTPGHTYFQKAGATFAEHEAEVRRCLGEAQKTNQPDTSAGAGAGGGLLGALVVGIVKGVMDGIADRRGVAANVENCMVVSGWTVRGLDETTGAAFAALPQAAQAEKLTAMLAAPEPVGSVARAYANDAQSTSTSMFTPAGDLDKLSLSLSSLPPIPKGQEPPIGPIQTPARMKKSAWPPKALKPEQLASVSPDTALVVVRVTGGGYQGGQQLVFTRTGPDPRTPAWIDGQPGSFGAALPAKMFPKRDETYDTTLVFAVPPGQWRLSAASRGLFMTSFCLGHPAFEIAKGETVFAGSFALSGDQIGPELDLKPAAAALAALPDRVASVRPASYVNGLTDTCGGAYIYALELPGAPFVEGYRYGSAAAAVRPVAPATTSVEAPATPVAMPANTTPATGGTHP